MTNCLCYARVSTASQAEDGYGLAEQRAVMQAWCEANGYNAQFYEDAGVSGELLIRPALSALLASSEPGTPVLVPRLDRLARSLITQEVILDDLSRRGVSMHSCSESEDHLLRGDDTDPTRTLIRQVLGAVAQFERSLVTTRLAAGRARKAAEGGYAYGAPPYGYEAKNGSLSPLRTEQDILAIIMDMTAEGASPTGIARYLNARGTPPRSGERWHSMTVSRIVNREALRAKRG